MVARLTPDGWQEVGAIPSNGCCPPALKYIDREALACSFIGLLPKGPLWDADKEAIAQGQDVDSCATLVRYARYNGHRLYYLLTSILWPAIRESSPYTAVTTLHDWLAKSGYVDCYGSCRNINLTKLSPLEIMTECGPVSCVTDFGDDYTKAYQSAIIQSVRRSRLVLMPPNIDAINYVLEPLAAEVIPDVPNPPANGCQSGAICLRLQKNGDTLPLPQEAIDAPTTVINAWLDLGCDRPAGLPQYIWPNLLAAECIVRSLISNPKFCLNADNCAEPEAA